MILKRQKSPPYCTFGTWYDEAGKVLCFTIERPWLDNKTGISCIPVGTYTFRKFNSPLHGLVWKADAVPGRDYIEIHPANWAYQLKGCIAVGDKISRVGRCVLNSKKTFGMLKSVLPDIFTLTITQE